MDEIDTEEILDEAEDEIEEGQDLRDAQMDSYSGSYPTEQQKDTLFNWFWRVVRLKRPFQLVKVGNLAKEEIGLHRISVRDSMNLWVLGHTFNHPTFGNYYATIAKINSATSMAKKGWFMDLSISQRKVRSREKSRQFGEQGWRLFGKKKPVQEE